MLVLLLLLLLGCLLTHRVGARATGKEAPCKNLLGRGKEASAFKGGSFPLGTAHPYTPEGVKKFKTGRDREGEAPAEPHGARTSGAMARQEARPPNSFTPPFQRRGIQRRTVSFGFPVQCSPQWDLGNPRSLWELTLQWAYVTFWLSAEIGRARLRPSPMGQGFAGAMARREARPPIFFTVGKVWREYAEGGTGKGT